MFKKLFYVVAMVALLAAASLPASAAYARVTMGGVKVNFANVTGAELVSTSPVAVKLTGSIVCDQPALTMVTVGRTTIVLVLDVAIPGSARPCGAPRSGSAIVTIPGKFYSGSYTILVNPNTNGSGAAQKSLTVDMPAVADDDVVPNRQCSAGDTLPCLPQP